ncbi:50S ribosomal protein L31 [Streptomyces sp. PSKA30]|uniref:50S ribosomal protein L31 n=1 Tax=Streptomyces sp. PSKA30 TaxID=2874597 RepID=UPI001CD1269C|nr:50S ribosomal protein L31 [Streptomyces sp. PSKA30]MBZ9644333.1 50S ribosomal protein L31 [Streptomyces sp. PSKA30]
MRPAVHPVSRPVVFRDRAAGVAFLTGPTASASHPFHTGTSRIVDTADRVERFERRYGRAAPARR